MPDHINMKVDTMKSLTCSAITNISVLRYLPDTGGAFGCFLIILLTMDELSPHRPVRRQSTSPFHEGVTLSHLSHRAITFVRQSFGVVPDISLTTDGFSFSARPRACHWSFNSDMVSTTSRSECSPIREIYWQFNN